MDDGVILSYNEYKYNQNNDVIEENYINPVNNISSITKYEYSYDANKNWVEKK